MTAKPDAPPPPHSAPEAALSRESGPARRARRGEAAETALPSLPVGGGVGALLARRWTLAKARRAALVNPDCPPLRQSLAVELSRALPAWMVSRLRGRGLLILAGALVAGPRALRRVMSAIGGRSSGGAAGSSKGPAGSSEHRRGEPVKR